MQRRVNMAAFLHKPPVVDDQLEVKLQAEWPAILRWMIAGCLDWQANGLIRPKSVIEATAKYFGEQDTLRQWVEECCHVGPNLADTNASLFTNWTDFAKLHGEDMGSQKRFNPAIPRPLRGDYHRRAVIVGWRRCRCVGRPRALAHNGRPLQRDRLPLPRRALVAVGRGDDAGHAVLPRAGRRWPCILGWQAGPCRGRGVPASPQRGICSSAVQFAHRLKLAEMLARIGRTAFESAGYPRQNGLRGFGLLDHGHCHSEPGRASATVRTQVSHHSNVSCARSIIGA